MTFPVREVFLAHEPVMSGLFWSCTFAFQVEIFIFNLLKKNNFGASLVFQRLRLHAPKAGGPGSFPDQGARSHVLQLRPSRAK